jgi:hypothetical protein
MKLDFIQVMLAGFLDKFKAKSPILFVAVASILTGAKFFVESGTVPIDPKITEWALWIIALVLNSGTFNFKDKSE